METQEQLLDAVFLNRAGRGFQIFTFPGSASQDDEGGEKISYEQRLETIERRISDEGEGGYLWVVGNRGTGKTEAIIHLMRKVVSNPSPDSSSHNPETRIPIFVSAIDKASRDEYLRVSKLEDKGQFDWSFIDFLARRGLAESLEWIAKTEQAGEFYPELRAALNKDTPDGYSKNWEVAAGLLNDPDYTLEKFLIGMKTVPDLAGRINPLLLVDDLDKQPYPAVQGLLSRAQPSVQSLAKNNVLFAFSVTPSFMNESRGMSGLNYLLEMSKRGNSRSELWVPEVAELRAVDLQDFLKHRLGYLVPDPKGGWRLPLQEIEGKMEEEEVEAMVSDWDTYNILNLRENGSMRVLTGWLTHIKQTGVRELLRLLEPLLSETPDDKELGPRLLLKKLKQNDSSQSDSISKYLIGRIEETEIVPGWLEEESRLMDDPVSSANYSLMINSVKDKVSTGRWFGDGWKSLSNERHKAASLIGLGDGDWPFDNSLRDIGRFASPNRLAMELAWQLETEPDVLPEVHSRTPEQFFQLLKSNPGILEAARNEAFAREISGSVHQGVPSPAATTQEDAEEPDPEPEDSAFDQEFLTLVERCYKLAFPRDITKMSDTITPEDIGVYRRKITVRVAQLLLGFENISSGQGRALSDNAKDDPTTFGRKLLFWMLLSRGGTMVGEEKRVRDLRILRRLMTTMEATNLGELLAFWEVKDEFDEWVQERQEYLHGQEEANRIERRGFVDPEAATHFSKWQVYLHLDYELPPLAEWLGAVVDSPKRELWHESKTVNVSGRLTLLDYQKKRDEHGMHAEIPQALSQFYTLLDEFETGDDTVILDTNKESTIKQIWQIIDITSPQKEQLRPEPKRTPVFEQIDTGGIERSSHKPKPRFIWLGWSPAPYEEHEGGDRALVWQIVSHFRVSYKIVVEARLYCLAEGLWEKILAISNEDPDAWIRMERSGVKRPLTALSRRPAYQFDKDSKVIAYDVDSTMPDINESQNGRTILWNKATIYYGCGKKERAQIASSSGKKLCTIKGPSAPENLAESLDWAEEEGDA